MKKFCIFLLMLSFVCTVTCGCAPKKAKPNMVKSERRFAKYVQSQNDGQSVVDLSVGPRQNYDAKLGPGSLNFDIKIVDPY